MAQILKVVPLSLYQKVFSGQRDGEHHQIDVLKDETLKNTAHNENAAISNMEEDKIEDKIKIVISKLDDSIQLEAYHILKKLLEDGKFDWDEQGQISFKDKREYFSYLPQILNVTLNNRSTSCPGFETFLEAIKDSKISVEILSKREPQISEDKIEEPKFNFKWIRFEDRFKIN